MATEKTLIRELVAALEKALADWEQCTSGVPDEMSMDWVEEAKNAVAKAHREA